jgi:hypothetical protein
MQPLLQLCGPSESEGWQAVGVGPDGKLTEEADA